MAVQVQYTLCHHKCINPLVLNVCRSSIISKVMKAGDPSQEMKKNIDKSDETACVSSLSN